MKICNAYLKSATPYSQSRIPQTPKLDKETHEDYEKRTWREKAHADGAGRVYIPAMAFKQAIDKAASMLGIQIPGRGKATYTKHFLAGCIVENDIHITENGKKPILKDEVAPERIYANADGKRGSGKRVWRVFPTVPKWEGVARFVIFDDAITKDVFEKHLSEAGKYVGVGRFRAENGGLYGRFSVERFEWE
jgi:hypothetical protein